MYDITFVDIPFIKYQSCDELSEQMGVYRRECDYIIKSVTGVDASEKELYYSMGILCLSSFLKTSIPGIQIGYIHYYLNLDDYEKYVKNTKVLAFSTMTVTMNTIIYLAELAHNINPQIKIILGGYHASYFAEDILRNNRFIECVFLFEGETSLLQYMQGKPKGSICGIAYRDSENRVVYNPFKKYLDKELIPIPDYSLIRSSFNVFNIQLSTMRGCIGKCNFCVNNSYWKCPRMIPVQRVIEELLLLKEHLPKGTVVHIIDNIFSANVDRLDELCRAMESHNLLGYFNFECDTLSSLIDADRVRLMERIGVFKICLGIEDCNDDILGFSNKGVKFSENIFAARTIKANSKCVCVYAYWIIGLPGTTISSMEENVNQMYAVIRDGIIDLISPKIFIPYPGTPFFEHPEKYGLKIVSHDWNSYERRNPPFPYHYENVPDEELYNYLIKALKICHKAYSSRYRISSNQL